MLTKSLVVGVHNGLDYLPYTINSLKDLPVDELIFVLDRCDKEAEHVNLIKKSIPKAKIVIKDFAYTRFRPCETFMTGFKHASGDLLFVTAEDIILDKSEFEDKYWLNSKVGMVDFRYYSYDPFKFNFNAIWDMALLKLSDKLGYGTVRSGLYGVRRSLYDAVGGLKDCPTEEDWLRLDIIKLGFRHVHIKSTKHLHLRPSYDKKRQIMQGVSRYEQHFPFWRVVAHSCLHIKPMVMVGYLQAWNRKAKQ